MAKTTYPYVIVWAAPHSTPGRDDVWTKKGAWGAHFRFDIMKLFRTLESAEREAFKFASMRGMVGEVRVRRFDEFVRDSNLDDHIKAFQMRVARKWMRRRPLPKYHERPGDPMAHGHNSATKVIVTARGGREYRCTWCDVKLGVRRIPRADV
jgi:hypothetical protein